MTDTNDAHRLRLAVLGPVRAWRGELPLHLGGPLQRAMLAMLVFRQGRVCGVDELIDGIWGDRPPVRATHSLRTYASRLRHTLGARAGESPIVWTCGGYTLRLPEGAVVDLAEFARTGAAAEAAEAAGDPVRATALWREALALVKGTVLTGLAGPFAERRQTQWEERRLALLERCLALDLECGRHGEATAELAALNRAYPLREGLCATFMLALYRSGRQAEALGVYERTRRRLSEEFGVDPGPQLREAYLRIVRAEVGVARAVGVGV